GGPATKAQFNQPHAIRFDPSGRYLYGCDIGNHRLRRVDLSSGVVTSFAGGGTRRNAPDGAPAGPSLPLNGPRAIHCHGPRRRRRGAAGAGFGTPSAADGTRRTAPEGAPAAPPLPLNGPRAIDCDARGDLWLALREGNAVYRIDTRAGKIHRVAGTGKQGFTG